MYSGARDISCPLILHKPLKWNWENNTKTNLQVWWPKRRHVEFPTQLDMKRRTMCRFFNTYNFLNKCSNFHYLANNFIIKTIYSCYIFNFHYNYRWEFIFCSGFFSVNITYVNFPTCCHTAGFQLLAKCSVCRAVIGQSRSCDLWSIPPNSRLNKHWRHLLLLWEYKCRKTDQP